MRSDPDLREIARQVTDETARCEVCNADIPFTHAVPVVPQPDDTEEGFMSVCAASVVLAGKDVVCDAQCLEVWESSESGGFRDE